MSSDTRDTESMQIQVAVKIDSRPAPVENRRSHRRLEVGLSAHCQIDGVVSQEALGDLSETGLFLRTRACSKIGARVRVVLGLPHIGGQRVCSLSGTVAWIDRGPDGEVSGAGVEFDHETDKQDHELLCGFLALWGEPVPRTSPAGA